jgi:hypothetical protein
MAPRRDRDLGLARAIEHDGGRDGAGVSPDADALEADIEIAVAVERRFDLAVHALGLLGRRGARDAIHRHHHDQPRPHGRDHVGRAACGAEAEGDRRERGGDNASATDASARGRCTAPHQAPPLARLLSVASAALDPSVSTSSMSLPDAERRGCAQRPANDTTPWPLCRDDRRRAWRPMMRAS